MAGRLKKHVCHTMGEDERVENHVWHMMREDGLVGVVMARRVWHMVGRLKKHVCHMMAGCC